MNNVIDLVPYLPQQMTEKTTEHRKNCAHSVAQTVESLVTLCIGTGFFLMLLAFFAAMI